MTGETFLGLTREKVFGRSSLLFFSFQERRFRVAAAVLRIRSHLVRIMRDVILSELSEALL